MTRRIALLSMLLFMLCVSQAWSVDCPDGWDDEVLGTYGLAFCITGWPCGESDCSNWTIPLCSHTFPGYLSWCGWEKNLITKDCSSGPEGAVGVRTVAVLCGGDQDSCPCCPIFEDTAQTIKWYINNTLVSGCTGDVCDADPLQYNLSWGCDAISEIANYTIKCEISNENSQYYVDDPITLQIQNYIRECYIDSTVNPGLTGNFTVEPIDGEGGTSMGQRVKTLTVCPGSWIRLEVDQIDDHDHKVLQNVNIEPVRWSISIGSLKTCAPADSHADGPTSCSVDTQAPWSKGEYTYSCTIYDLPDEYGDAWDTGTRCVAEYQDDPKTYEVTVIVTDPPECVDVRTSDTFGSGGCCGGGGGIKVDWFNGSANSNFSIPGVSCAGVVTACGPNATWSTPNGCYYFVKSGATWVCTTDSRIQFSASNGNATIITPSGATYNFSRVDPSGYTFYPTELADSLGRSTTFNYDTSTHKLISAEMSDGRSISYDHTLGASILQPSSVAGPDGVYRTFITYENVDGKQLPMTVTVKDPADPSEYTTTAYDYYSNGKLKSIRSNSGLETRVQYDYDGNVIWKWELNGSTFYSQTGYIYNRSSGGFLEYDSNSTHGPYYDYTEVREYALDGTNIPVLNQDDTIDEADIDEANDRITTHYYLESGFLRAVENRHWDEAANAYVADQSTIYDRILPGDNDYVNVTTDSLLYGAVKRAITIDGYELDYPYDPINEQETLYTYYDPNRNYDVTDLNAVPYPVATSGGVPGNGQIKSVTTSEGGVTHYSYKIESGEMKPYVMLTKDVLSHITKNITDSYGRTIEVQEEDEENPGIFVPVRSNTYYSTGANLGKVESATVYGVATSGANRDMVTKYYYAQDNEYDGETVTTKIVQPDSTEKTTNVSHYNALGQLRKQVDEQDNTTLYEYDYQGRNTVTTFPAIAAQVTPLVFGDTARSVINNYTCCHLESTQDEEQNLTHYTYDGKSRVEKTWTDITGQSSTQPLVQYGYGIFGQLKTVTTQSGQSQPRVTSYEYDRNGRMTKMIYPYETAEGQFIGSEEYIYDTRGRVVLKRDGEGKITAYAYDQYGRLSGVDYDYTGVFALTDPWPDTNYFSADVSYDEYVPYTSLVSEVSETIGGTSVTSCYEYDRYGRIESYKPGLPVNYGTVVYTYNGLGQKTSMIVPLGIANKAKKIVYSYDNTGKQTGTHVVSQTTNDSYTTTPEKLTSPSGDLEFFYDDSRSRVKLINKTGDVYYFVYDPTASIPAVIYEQGPSVMDGENETGKRYVNIREPDGDLLSRETYDIDGERTCHRAYHYDGLGSVVALSDESGNITDTYSYDEWGNVTPGLNNQTLDNPYQYVGQYGYYTHHQQADFRLLQLGVRYYDPETGRFTQRDQVEREELSAFLYVDASPLLMVDPNGLYPRPGCNPKKADPAVQSCIKKALAKIAPPTSEKEWKKLMAAVIGCFKKATYESMCDWLPCALAEANPDWLGSAVWPNACDQIANEPGCAWKFNACGGCATQRGLSCYCKATAKHWKSPGALAKELGVCVGKMQAEQLQCMLDYQYD